MLAPINIPTELQRHREANNGRMKHLVEEQYNVETTHPFFLRFTAADREDAVGLGRLLFAKGMRLMTPEPRSTGDGWQVEVVVKHNLREITQEDFTCDLVTLACGIRATYDCWDFLSEDSAEQNQSHNDNPEVH